MTPPSLPVVQRVRWHLPAKIMQRTPLGGPTFALIETDEGVNETAGTL